MVSLETGLQAGQQRNHGSIPSRGKRFYFFQSSEAGCGPHPIGCLVRTKSLFAGSKVAKM